MTAARSRMLNGSYEHMKPSRFIDEIPDACCEKHMLRRAGEDPFEPDFGDFEGFHLFGGDRGRSRSDVRDEASGHAGRSSRTYGLDKAAAGSIQKKSGIPKGLMQQGIQRLQTLDYGVGDRVQHIRFGEGTVTAIEDGKKDFTVTVSFDTAGQKRLLASFAKLRKL